MSGNWLPWAVIVAALACAGMVAFGLSFMRRQMFARKSLDMLLAEMAGEHRLHRVLGPVALTALGVGAIIGAGIFAMTGRVAAQDAGPAVVLSYAVAATGCLFAALCYAEFAAMAPVAGSAYTYAYATLGEMLAWIIGWDLILEYAMSCATVAAHWTHYFNELLGALFGKDWVLPAVICHDPFTKVDGAYVGICNLPGAVILALVTGVLVLGMRESAATNAILVVVKLAVVLFVIALGWVYVSADNWTTVPIETRLAVDDPVEAKAKWGMIGQLGLDTQLQQIDDRFRSPFMPYGVSGVMLGAALVFFAFIGFDSISTHSEEAIRPQRDIPIGILVSLIVCTVLYMAVSAVITGMVPYPKIDPNAALASAFGDLAVQHNSTPLRLATVLIAAGGLAGMTSVLLVTFLSQARVFLAMSRDGLMPKLFGEVHEKYGTPHLSTMLTGGLMCVVTAFTPIHTLEQMVNIGTLLAFVIVCAAVLLLRINRPDATRPFRCPGLWVVAPLGIFVNVTLMLFLPLDTWARLAIWLAMGLAIYFLYSRRHSVLGHSLADQLRRQGLSPTDAPLSDVGR